MEGNPRPREIEWPPCEIWKDELKVYSFFIPEMVFDITSLTFSSKYNPITKESMKVTIPSKEF